MKRLAPILLFLIAIGIVVLLRSVTPRPASPTQPSYERAETAPKAHTPPTSKASIATKQTDVSNNQSPSYPKPDQASTSVDIEIKRLIDLIGTRTKPKEQPHNLASLASQHNEDMNLPLGEVFPSAQELVSKGESAAVPLARYWATLQDPTSDTYIAATRALRALQSREKTHELFLELAKQESNAERRSSYLHAAKRFAPINTAPTP